MSWSKLLRQSYNIKRGGGAEKLVPVNLYLVEHQAAQDFVRSKIVTADEAIALIRDDDTLSSTGFVQIGFAEALLAGAGTALPRNGYA